MLYTISLDGVNNGTCAQSLVTPFPAAHSYIEFVSLSLLLIFYSIIYGVLKHR